MPEYSRIKITKNLNVHAFSTIERFAGGIVVIPPGALEGDRKYFRGEVGDALAAFLDGTVDFPVVNGTLDIAAGWTERRVAQDIADNWTVEEPQPQPAPQEPITRVPRLNMKRIKELEGS